MKRRNFIKSAAIAAPALSVAGLAQASPAKTTGEYYELRKYTLKNGTQQKLVEDYFRDAFIPAAKKGGLGPIGVFKEYLPQTQTALYVVIAFPTLSTFETFNNNLETDKAYQQSAEPYLKAPFDKPAYERIETSLSKSFNGFPKVQVPEQKPRLFEMRRYESSGEVNGKLKVQMFNEGEFPIFIRTGLKPVLFGEVLIGPNRPNLTYMIVFDDMKAHDENWDKFGKDPAWKVLSAKPEYQNTVSNIVRTFLVPVEGSHI